MSKSIYYSKLAELKLQYRLDFAVDGSMLLKVPIEEKTSIPEYIVMENLFEIVDSQSETVDSKPRDRASSEASGSIQSLQSYLSLQETEREISVDSEFRRWLLNKANSLPPKPALLEQWVESEAQKPINQREFLRELETLQQTSIPAIPQTEEILDPQEYWRRVHERTNGSL